MIHKIPISHALPNRIENFLSLYLNPSPYEIMLFLSGDSGTHCRVADGEGPKNAIIEDYTKKKWSFSPVRALPSAWEQQEKTCDSYTNEGIQLNMHPRRYEPLPLGYDKNV